MTYSGYSQQIKHFAAVTPRIRIAVLCLTLVYIHIDTSIHTTHTDTGTQNHLHRQTMTHTDTGTQNHLHRQTTTHTGTGTQKYASVHYLSISTVQADM